MTEPTAAEAAMPRLHHEVFDALARMCAAGNATEATEAKQFTIQADDLAPVAAYLYLLIGPNGEGVDPLQERMVPRAELRARLARVSFTLAAVARAQGGAIELSPEEFAAGAHGELDIYGDETGRVRVIHDPACTCPTHSKH